MLEYFLFILICVCIQRFLLLLILPKHNIVFYYKKNTPLNRYEHSVQAAFSSGTRMTKLSHRLAIPSVRFQHSQSGTKAETALNSMESDAFMRCEQVQFETSDGTVSMWKLCFKTQCRLDQPSVLCWLFMDLRDLIKTSNM
ncbi:hypothetical protein KIN20_024972 [Parelaphostrongylus tenuis]|uniref:Uncharacterized protein n=1 Tax=Parelaphostrongylus tenuis TaxID=148309 RepID=A0AAD5MUC7_PARTN|nr:hypothetical protein KIN20_024972 [Parelaphostrongylus tenuis]